MLRMTCLAATLAAGLCAPTWAQDTQALQAQLSQLAARLQALEAQNTDTQAALSNERISEKDPELATRLKYAESQIEAMKSPTKKVVDALKEVKVGGSITTVTQGVSASGTSTGTNESRSNYRGDLNVTLPVGSMGDNEGKLFTHLRFGQGKGVALRPTYTSSVNSTAFQTAASADDSFAILAQAWYQLKMPLNVEARKEDARENLYITVGKIDPFGFFDQNAAADDETTRFMNNVFVHNPLLDSGGDIAADAYGFMPGAVVKYENSAQKGGEWALSLGAFASGDGANFSGSSHASFVIGQAELNTRLNYLPGTWRLYAWNNSRAKDYNAALQTSTGWGTSVNQKISDDLTLFGRYGQHSNGLVKFDRALTLGLELEGSAWSRSADSIGIALGNLQTSDTYRIDSATVSSYSATGNERQAELYYRYKLNSNVELTFNCQWIDAPGGDASAASGRATGVRAKIGF